jgi:phosphomannomutase
MPSGHVPERDGILANLYLLDLMQRTGKKPSELVEMLFDLVGSPHYYDRIDTARMRRKSRKRARGSMLPAETVGGLKVTTKNSTDGYKFDMEDGGWLLVRFSGTEPLIRVYTETTHGDKVQAILQDACGWLGWRDDGIRQEAGVRGHALPSRPAAVRPGPRASHREGL